MAAALFGKKDSAHAEASETSGDDPGELEQLTDQLGKLGQLLHDANRQIAAYLVRRESRASAAAPSEEAPGALAEKIAALSEKVDQLTAKGTSATSATPAAPSGSDDKALKAAMESALEPLQEKLDRIDAALKALSESRPSDAAPEGPSNAAILDAVGQLQTRLDAGLQRLADLVAPEEEEADAKQAPTSTQWEQAILGPELAGQPALAFQRQQLISGLLEGDPGACALAGQLLVFQSAPAERLPQLLKDTGEAFYRWQPKRTPGTNPVEEALVRWLEKHCEDAGIGNTIALVHPGERFDSARHTASSRGVEITEVHGWIVLRDNGKVYTKATVSVR